MNVDTLALSQSVRVPLSRLRPLYIAKAGAMLFLLGFLFVLKWTVLPVTPAERDAVVILIVLLPTLAIVYWQHEIPPWLLGLSFGADIFAVTCGIHYGGGSDNTSGPTLYVVLIALAGIVVSPRAARRVAAASTAAYAAVTWAEYAGWLPHWVPYAKSAGDAVATVGVIGVYLFVVSGLVSYAARQIRLLHLHVEELQGETLGARSATIVFSDMEGFTPMIERLGDREAHRVSETHNHIVRQQVAAHEGVEVELQGDGFVLAFATPQQAVRCAIQIQRDCAAYSHAHPNEPIRVRIGIHTGEAIRARERFFGKTLVVAMRIAALGAGGEIRASSRVKELVESAAGVVFDDGVAVTLPGFSAPYTVHPVLWDVATDPG